MVISPLERRLGAEGWPRLAPICTQALQVCGVAVKRLRYTLKDGRVFDLDAHIVAHDRAVYYAAQDPDTTFQQEYDFTLRDDAELIDWAQNNMDWYEHPVCEVIQMPKNISDVSVESIEVLL